jgi:hypothetical protein
VELMLNRSPTIAPLRFISESAGLYVEGCGCIKNFTNVKRGDYLIVLSLITPYVRLMNDGKTPYLGDFQDGITAALQKAGSAAYRAMARPQKQMSLKEAVYAVMEEAYLKVSDNGDEPRLPANARQIMYAARPAILKITGIDKLNDKYFTQTLLPDYMNDHPEETAEWDVVFDARGHLREPHTRRSVPIGTIAVRNYLGLRRSVGSAVEFNVSQMFPTSGPRHRYRNILFIEKEGFDPLLEEARIGEKFDVSVMSTKGMSVTAARRLIDRLFEADLIDCVYVLHDFDVSGFSIFGTLGADGRRYTYKKKGKFVDLGLRLEDVDGLESEPAEIKGDTAARAETLRTHGATEDEIRFLLGQKSESPRRVELNAMTSLQLIEFIERKLTEYGVKKVVPDDETIERHARRLIEGNLTAQALDEIREDIVEQARQEPLPDNLVEQIRQLLKDDPTLSWDRALALVLI